MHVLPRARYDKQATQRYSTESNELYIAGNRQGRDASMLFLHLFYRSWCCRLAYIRVANSREREIVTIDKLRRKILWDALAGAGDSVVPTVAGHKSSQSHSNRESKLKWIDQQTVVSDGSGCQ